ncbi:MAG: cell wall anchor protein [Verrucomicrobiota bacterium JB024]|nr:cell wall anchor protein [Verrucomicrobiota bacterium JB024]
MNNLIKLSAWIAAGCLPFAFAQADLPTFEGFDYTNGSALIQGSGPDGAGGTGWNNRWTGSGTATIITTDDAISFTDGNGVVYGSGNSVAFSGASTQNAASRTFASSTNTSGADIYFSFIFQVTNGSTTGVINSGSFMSVGVLDSNISVAVDNFAVITSGRVGARVNNVTERIMDTPITYQTTFLVVGKLSGWEDGVYKTMTVWLNPTIADENNTSISITASSTTGADGYRGVIFRTYNLDASGDVFHYDDLRMGSSWDTVVIPEPANGALYGLLGIVLLGGVLFGRKRR